MTTAAESLATGTAWGAPASAATRSYQPLIPVALALAAGIVMTCQAGGAVADWRFGTWWYIAAICLAAWWWAFRGGHFAASAVLLLAAVANSGAAWQDLHWDYFSRHDIGRFARSESLPACARATVLSAPEFLPAPRATPLRAIPGLERSRLEIRLTRIRDGTRWRRADGHCELLVDGHLLGVRPGDELQLFGQLSEPRRPMNPGEFDFAGYARGERHLATFAAQSPDCIAVVDPDDGWSFADAVGKVRAAGKQLLRTYVGPGQAGLASAILLGDRAGLPSEEIEPFMLTGTVHLLVVSGLNVAILATGLYALVWIGWLPRRFALAAIVVIVAAYALVAGAEPPVLRAAILVSIVCAGAWTGRRGVAFNSLAAAAIVVLALNPSELFQTGTQLSFLCVAVLIWVGHWPWRRAPYALDPLDRLIAASRPWYAKVARRVGWWTVFLLLTSTAVWLATLPLVLGRFHVASPVALLIAPVVWLLALVAMWAGFITLACGWLMPIVASFSGAVCGWSLDCLASVVHWAEAVPGGHFWAPGPALWWLLGFYAGLCAVMIWSPARLRPRWLVAAACLWILIGLVLPLARAWTRDDALRTTFVAMGHGTCVVFETPSGQTLLYDAGSLGSPEYATQTVANYLWHRGKMRIDAMILSHADVDHFNAVPGLLERFRVGAVYVSPQLFDGYGTAGPPDAPHVLHDAITAAGVPIREVWAGDRLRVGDVSLAVLHPPKDGVLGSDNANSITLAVEHAGRRILLPGDLESPGLEDVIAELAVDCDVLMAPHHGSRRSDPPGFAAWSTPEWVVISGGADADPGVRQTYALAGAKVLSTGEVGAVELLVDRRGIQATCWLPSANYQIPEAPAAATASTR